MKLRYRNNVSVVELYLYLSPSDGRPLAEYWWQCL